MMTRWAAWLTLTLATTALVSAQRPTGPEGAPVFAGDSVLQLRIEAPLQSLFADGRKNPDSEVTGTLAYTDETSGRAVVLRNVVFGVRGHTSIQPTECTFPKLKAKLSRAEGVDGSIFRGLKTIKIGTHCGERPDTELTQKGRLANEKSAAREAFVYRLLGVLGVTSFQARPAAITYVDGDQPLTRKGLVLEDMPTALVRIGAD